MRTLYFFLVLAYAFLLITCQSADTMNQESTPTPESNALQIPDGFDWQGHRGARGLLPENSIPAFLLALDHPVKTLELDVAISKDNQVIISHEPWFSAGISQKPDGTPVTIEEERSLRIYEMTYEEIKTYDCGSRGNEKFPEQKGMLTFKPSLKDMVEAVEAYAEKKGREKPFYNIEIKSEPELDGTFTPPPAEFAALLLEEVTALGIANRTTIQSFDVRPLQILHEQKAPVTLAYLVMNMDGVEDNMKKLGFTPDIYSPYYQLVTKDLVSYLHEQNIKLIPWTVNDQEVMKNLIRLGVDGIITDYPNYIGEI